jgi:signal peptide peptidase SppA
MSRRNNKGRFANLIHAVYCDPWLIRPAMHVTIAEILHAHVTGEAHKAGGIAELFGIKEDEDPISTMIEDVAVIAVDGVIGKRVSALEKSSGTVDVDDVAAALREAYDNRAVRGIVLDINSPGGTVTGVPELASLVASAPKRVVAYTDTMAASAAYWIGSQADAFVAAPSSTVGSVGVYLALLDQSRAYELAGYRKEVIKSGKIKGIGVPGTALTDEQRAHLQQATDALHAQFKAAVRAGRKGVRDEDMEGQDFYGAVAVDARLIDETGDMAEAVRLAQK